MINGLVLLADLFNMTFPIFTVISIIIGNIG